MHYIYWNHSIKVLLEVRAQQKKDCGISLKIKVKHNPSILCFII